MKSRRLFPMLVILPLLLVMSTGHSVQAAKQSYKRTVVDYQIPDVTLINQNGETVPLVGYLTADQPILLEFIFATCTTICPILSVGFTNLQRKLGAEAAGVRLVSVSIDPEYDTPPIMKKYLERYNAKPGWDFLTGTEEDIFKVMKAFDAYVPDKMAHMPLTFMRSPKDGKWVRIYGLIGGKTMMKEYLALAR